MKHIPIHMTILSSLFCRRQEESVSEQVRTYSTSLYFYHLDQGSAEPGDGFVVQCNRVALFVPPTSKSTFVWPLWTLNCFGLSRCQPRFSCGVDNSPVVNNSRIE